MDWEQGSANRADVQRGVEEHRNTRGTLNTGNTKEQEVESDNKTQDYKIKHKITNQKPKPWHF